MSKSKQPKNWFKVTQFLPMEYTLYNQNKKEDWLGYKKIDVKYVGVDPYGNICGVIGMTECGPVTLCSMDEMSGVEWFYDIKKPKSKKEKKK